MSFDINQNFAQMDKIDFINNTDGFSKKELEESYRALSSMLNKCKKAQEKLSMEKWQWRLMESNIRALEIAMPIIINSSDNSFSKNDINEAIKELSSSLDKTEKIRSKLKLGSSQWTLNKNRTNALKITLFLLSKTLKDDKNLV